MSARGDGRVWIGLLILAALLRLALVASLGDVFFTGEELAKGAAARAMAAGVPIAHADLAYHAYEGGGFVISHLDRLAFALFGPSLLTLKLVALGWHLATLAAGAWLAARCFGHSAGHAFLALGALAPLAVQQLSLLALGIHLEACLFLALILGLTAVVLEERKTPARRWFALGLAAGLGLYFNCQIALSIAFVGLALVATRAREVFSMRGLAAVGGGLLGLAPLGYMALHHGAKGLDVHGAGLFETGDLSRMGDFVAAMLAGRGPFELAAYALRAAAFAGAAGWLAARAPTRERRAAWLLLGYLVFFLAVYATSDFAVAELPHHFYFMRLAQVWFLGTLVVAGAVGLAWDTRGKFPVRARSAALALAALAAVGAVDVARALGPRPPRTWVANLEGLAQRPGWLHRGYTELVAQRLEGSPEDRVRTLLALAPASERSLAMAIGWQVISPASDDLASAIALAERADPARALDMLRGLGPLWFRLHGDVVPDAALAGVDGERLEALRFAYGHYAQSDGTTRGILLRRIEAARAAGAPRAVLEGLGWRVSESVGTERDAEGRHVPPFGADPAGARAWIETFESPTREGLLAGFDAAQAAAMPREASQVAD
ncbi:MAG TPA: hypothetical protein VMT18_08580 [Planctomycetota bacterium]|nr:hypothetical protein [Planctomycetota bacterium]